MDKPLVVSEMTPDGVVQIPTEAYREQIRRMLDAKGYESGLRLWNYQKRLLGDQNQYKRIRWSRQIGKSHVISLDDVFSAMRTGYGVMELSAGMDQTKELILKAAMHLEALQGIAGEIQREILKGNLNELMYVDADGVKITQTVLSLPNGTRIFGRPANPRTARGYSVHVTLDEFNLHQQGDEIWNACNPSVSSNPILTLKVASTPKGKRHRFYRICTEKTITERDDDGELGIWTDHT